MFFTLREHSPFWPKQVCAAEQCMVFRVLTVYNFNIKCLEQGVF